MDLFIDLCYIELSDLVGWQKNIGEKKLMWMYQHVFVFVCAWGWYGGWKQKYFVP